MATAVHQVVNSASVSPNTYLRYKAATDTFKSFLCTTLQAARDRLVTTDDIDTLVDQVCAKAEANVKQKDFKTRLKDACDACALAIGIRESCSKKYLKFQNDANAGHLHFIEILKGSLRKLKTAYKDFIATPTAASDAGDADSADADDVASTVRNTFSALSLEREGDEADGGDEVDPIDISLGFAASTETSSGYSSKTSASGGGGSVKSADKDEVSKTAAECFEFEEDLIFQIVTFVTEIEDIFEQVSLAWIGVKEETKSIISASIITSAAIDSVQSLSASLEINFPSITTHTDLVTVMEKYLPDSFFKESTLATATSYHAYATSGYSRHFYTKGAEVNEMKTICDVLEMYSAKLETRSSSKTAVSLLKEGIFGAAYNENVPTKPLMAPPPSKKLLAGGTNIDIIVMMKEVEFNAENDRVFTFLMGELPALERLANILDTNLDIGGITVGGIFLKIIKKFFNDQKVTTTLVFTVLCWLKSVMYLQGECYIQRTVSLLKNQLVDIHSRLARSIDKGHVNKSDKELHAIMKLLATCIHNIFLDEKSQASFLFFYKHNPFGASDMVVSTFLQCLHISSETLLVTSRFRAFGHLYSALLDRKLLQNIPYLDNLLEVYKEMIFCPSRPKFGGFVTSYLLSSHLTARTVASLTGKTANKSRSKNLEIIRRKALHAQDLSVVYQYFTGGDRSHVIFKDALSFADVVKSLGLISAQELFTSRIIGHDVFAINDFLSEIFEELTDILDRRSFYDRYVATGHPQQHDKLSVHYRIQRAGEDSVMNPLIYILDVIKPDGSNIKDVPGLLSCVAALESTGSRNYYAYCVAAANFMKEKFSALDIEKTFFIFPTSVNPISKEYGKASIVKSQDNPQPKGYDTMDKFTSWLDRFEFQSHRLLPEELVKFKNEIKRDPGIISHTCFDQVPTIFQWLIAGPHADEQLAEWCINMGAVYFESINRFWESNAGLKERAIMTSGMMAAEINNNPTSCLERVVLTGSFQMLKLILESNSSISVNVRSGGTLNSMAHLACMLNKKDMYEYLKYRGVDLSVSNKKGKLFYEMTKDAVWAQELRIDYEFYLQMTSDAAQRRKTSSVRTQQNGAKLLQRQNLVLKSLSDQKIHGIKPAASGASGGGGGGASKQKQGVNDKCNCGSGKKFKKCCMI